MDNREAFEKWAMDNIVGFSFDKKTGGILSYRVTECAWEVWQAATAHNRDAVIDLLEKVEAALKLSQSICDAVPTMAHHSEDSAMSALGRLVNLQEDGTHGYSTIRETESAVSEFLNSLRSLKTNKEG